MANFFTPDNSREVLPGYIFATYMAWTGDNVIKYVGDFSVTLNKKLSTEEIEHEIGGKYIGEYISKDKKYLSILFSDKDVARNWVYNQ